MTADVESGYGESLDALRETIRQVIESGIVGINLEDNLQEGNALRPVAEQCQRISAVIQVADGLGIRLVINARVDCFLSGTFTDMAMAMEETIARAAAYSEAGADCIYPIGPGDEETIRELRQRIPHPINVLGSPTAAPLAVMRRLGVNRVSFGPYLFRSCIQKFLEVVDGLQTGEGYACFGKVPSSAEVAQYLNAEPEGP